MGAKHLVYLAFGLFALGGLGLTAGALPGGAAAREAQSHFAPASNTYNSSSMFNFEAEASVPLTTPTPFPTFTPTPALTRTPSPTSGTVTVTATPTSISQCYMYVAQAQSYCPEPDAYGYEFQLYRSCDLSYRAEIYLEAAPDVGGPWVGFQEHVIPQTTATVLQGGFNFNIPEKHNWYRIRIYGYILATGRSFGDWAEPMRICGRPPPCPLSWNDMAPYPIPVWDHTAASHADSLYSFGGRSNGSIEISNAYRYAPATDSWTTIAPMPGVRSGASAVAGDGYIYVMNGWDGTRSTDTLFRYDPKTNSYSSGPNGLIATSYQAAAYLDGKLYRIGGFNASVATNSVEIYGEKMVAPLPDTLASGMAVALGGYIYVAGGVASSGWSTKTYRYDPLSDTWDDDAIADLPSRRIAAASGILDGKWVLAGGTYVGMNSAIAWDPATNTWSSLTPMLYERSSLAGGVVGQAFYAVGGRDDSGPTNTTQEYVPAKCGSPTPATATATRTASATTTPVTCEQYWKVYYTFPRFLPERDLDSVVAISANDVWAAGYIRETLGAPTETLIMHWDGESWSRVTSPSPGAYINKLFGIDAISAGEIWAVGYSSDSSSSFVPLAMRWDGVQWNVAATPHTGASFHTLSGVKAIAPNDVWAVGAHGEDYLTRRTLIMHWDGAAWSIVPSPNAGSGANYLAQVDGVSTNDVWAVGTSSGGTLILRWDGATWEAMIGPKPGVSSELLAVAAISSDNVWAVGSYSEDDARRGLIVHWDGTRWTVSPMEFIWNANFERITGIVAISPDNILAVGTYGNDHPTYMTKFLIKRWDGTRWSQGAGPTVYYTVTDAQSLHAISAVSPDDIWAVGVEGVIIRYSSDFIDLQPNDPFYANVRCLVCREIMGGYEDGTFRPNNDITRGQLSKIVSNAAGFNEQVPVQHFEDVPRDNSFYVFVERMWNRGIINGYPCGGTGEPCVGPDNRPYFRPDANATRGQISKIVSNAKGYNDPVSGQIFEDVPPGSAFYDWVQRLASRGIMGGYPCGGAGEPCGSGNRPYFRPNNNATRGQTSKIVANTFFPGCETQLQP